MKAICDFVLVFDLWWGDCPEKLKIANDGSWTVDTTQFGVHSGKPLNLGNTRSDAEYLYTETMGSGTAFDVRQATIYLNYIIKY